MHNVSRRDFLRTTSAAAALCSAPGAWAAGYGSANERPVIGYIGTGIRYRSLVSAGSQFGPAAALCDVDSQQLANGHSRLNELYADRGLAAPTPQLYDDYRRVLDRPDIDIVVIASPDHWHTKMAIDAMLAGKDVYCEKPLTHHVAEGQQILAALDRTKRVMQVGSQQRSGKQFQTAVAMARAEVAGKVQRVTCSLQDCPSCDSLPAVAPPGTLNWNRWLGPAPYVAYREAPQKPEGGYGSQHAYGRSHAHFRWWYEYAGGKLTDWGAHHVDIAMWGLGKSDGSIGRFTIEPIRVDHPVEFKDGYPVVDDRFNTATGFEVRVTFEDGVVMDIVDTSERLRFDNGIMFECENGRFLVNRGKLVGKPVEDLPQNPLSDEVFSGLYPGWTADVDPAKNDDSNNERGKSHMQNFMDCVKSRDTPVSDVASHHRHLSVCHVANIAMRLGRKLTYDPLSERFVNDPQADSFLSRDYRAGFEIEG